MTDAGAHLTSIIGRMTDGIFFGATFCEM